MSAFPAGRFPAIPPSSEFRDQHGRDPDTLSRQSPVLLVFLRHFGCTFCREALADLAARRAQLEASGVQLCLAHQSDRVRAGQVLARYGLAEVPHISDPERKLYEAFELRRGRVGQVLGWRSWLRGAMAGVLNGHGIGWLEGDGFQMPGAFLLYQGQILRAFRHAHAADRPDYLALAACELPA
ncbi:MAG: SelL-related redox protein [Bacteroidia bacterium]|nr:SelL-related redox protein [Bacteroidia bacterium]